MKVKKKLSMQILSHAMTLAMVLTLMPATALAEKLPNAEPEAIIAEEPKAESKVEPKAEPSEEAAAGSTAEPTAQAAPLATNKAISKRTMSLDLRNGFIVDKDGNSLTPTDKVYDMLDAEGWKWNSNTNTLTLNGVNIEAPDRCAILFPANTTIELTGSNSAVSGDSIGLQMEGTGDLTISGTGTLTVNSQYVGILSYGDMIISGGTIAVTSVVENAILAHGALTIGGTANVDTSGYYCGLQSTGSGITISGGTVVAKSSDANAIYTDGTLAISGTANVDTSGYYCGLQAAAGINISGGTVAAVSSDANAIYTAGTLDISGNADLTATGGGTGCALNSGGSMTIGDSIIEATSPNDSAIFTPADITVSGNADITATGDKCGLQADGKILISKGTVDAAGTKSHAVTAGGKLTVSGTADVTAINNGTADEGWCALNSADSISIAGGIVNATSASGHAVYAKGSITAAEDSDITADGYWAALFSQDNITLNGKLQAEGNESTAIMADAGTITVGAKADITAASATGAGIFTAKGLTSSGEIDAVGGGNSGISSYGPLNITGGKIHAKGASGTAALYTYFEQSGNEAADTQITLKNLIEKNGCKISFSDWSAHKGSNKSWTSFILKDDTKLNTEADGTMDNAVNEIYLGVPWTVTFDVNGGSGTNANVKVYPGNKVTAPETNPAKDGCHFSGWYLDSTKFDFANTAVTKDITLKAKLDSHIWDTAWTIDSNNHWHKCKSSDCTQIKDKAAHTPGEAATTEHAQVCTSCEYVIAPKLPSKNAIVDAATDMRVEYIDGSPFDVKVVLSVVSESQQEMDKFTSAVDKATPGFVLGGLYDVKLLKDGVEIQPDGKVRVSIPLSEKLQAMTDLKVVYIDDNGNITTIPSEVKEGMIVFVTDHFSYYGVIGKVKADVPVHGNSAKTGDTAPVLLFVLMILASGTALIVLAKKRRVFKKRTKYQKLL